jgi:hypothetical protein
VPVATELPTYSNSRSVRPCSRCSSFALDITGPEWNSIEPLNRIGYRSPCQTR